MGSCEKDRAYQGMHFDMEYELKVGYGVSTAVVFYRG